MKLDDLRHDSDLARKEPVTEKDRKYKERYSKVIAILIK